MVMKSLEDIYKGSFFSKRSKFVWRAVHIADSFEKIFPGIYSYIDVGCATGDLVFEMYRRGYHAWGIEGSRNCWDHRLTDRIEIVDIRLPMVHPLRYDLCTCLEVMEHIEEEYANIMVDNLIKLSDKILISAAPPGQKGHYHVNCQPMVYWIEKFSLRGYRHVPVLTNAWRNSLIQWRDKPGIKAFFNNCAIFERKK